MVTTRPLQVAGYCGPGLPNMPLGTMLLPADNEARFEHSRACVQSVLESGEYRYERAAVEPVHTLVDVGVNLGAFTLWATRCWWPGIRQVWGFDPNAEALALAERNVGYTMRGPCANGTTACPGGVESLEDAPSNTWAGLRVHNASVDLLYLEYRRGPKAVIAASSTNHTEAYDLAIDPWQLVNLAPCVGVAGCARVVPPAPPSLTHSPPPGRAVWPG